MIKRHLALFPRLVMFTAIFLVFALVFLAMFAMFEAISIQAMLRMNTEFSAQVSTISDSMHSIINAIGTQVFYISSTAKLRQSSAMTTNERVFALRELWQYVSASSMLYSIYVFNGKLDYVFTTDNTYSSGSMHSFYDQDAVALFQERAVGNRMEFKHRVFTSSGDDSTPQMEMFSYLVYEVTANGKVGDSAIMLNLYPGWFSGNLLSFSGESYIILSPEGDVIAAQSQRLHKHAMALLPKISGGQSGYRIDTLDGERTICFYSPLKTNGWYCLRFVSYAECLPGLSRLRSAALLVLAAVSTLLLAAFVVALVRVYDPYRRMSTVISSAPEMEEGMQVTDRLERIVASSWDRKREEALRMWLGGREASSGMPPPAFPAVMLLMECLLDSPLRALVSQEMPEAITLQREDATVALCACGSVQVAAEWCTHLASVLNCRCYYSLPLSSLQDLPACYAALTELKRLRFFYPGQRVFAQSLMDHLHESPETMETPLNACFATARAGGDVDEAFRQLMEHLRACRFQDLLFVLQRLEHMLDKARPDDARTDEPLEAALLRAENPTAVSAHFLPRLQALADFHQAQRRSRSRDVAMNVDRRLREGFRDPAISAQAIAEEMGLSVAYLRMQFSSELCASIGDRLNELRIQEACRLLRETDLGVEDIALRIGLENTKYLFVLFKKIMGITPRQYRTRAALPAP